MEMSKILAVGFDYGGVIAGTPSPVWNAGISETLGISTEEFSNIWYRRNADWNSGNISKDELWKLITADASNEDSYSDVLAFLEKSSKVGVDDRVLDLAGRLKGLGLKVGILSNNPPEMLDKMLELGMGDVFDVIQVSGVTKLAKPSLEAYKHFADELGVEVNEMAFVDDSSNSLRTSKESGFKPILYEGYEGLVERLGELGVEV